MDGPAINKEAESNPGPPMICPMTVHVKIGVNVYVPNRNTTPTQTTSHKQHHASTYQIKQTGACVYYKSTLMASPTIQEKLKRLTITTQLADTITVQEKSRISNTHHTTS